MIVGYYLPGNRAAPPPGHRSGGRRSRTAFIWLLHLPGTAQEGRGQIDLAPPPHLRCPLLHGAREVEQPCFLVGNNQLTSPTPYTLYYYLPELVMGTRGIWRREEKNRENEIGEKNRKIEVFVRAAADGDWAVPASTVLLHPETSNALQPFCNHCSPIMKLPLLGRSSERWGC